MVKAKLLSGNEEGVNGVAITDEEKEELSKSDKILDKAKSESSFLKVF